MTIMRSVTISLDRNLEQLNKAYFKIFSHFIQLDPVIIESAAGMVFSAQLQEFLKNSIDAGADSAEFLFGRNQEGNVEIRIKDNGTTKIPTEKLGTYNWRDVLFTESSKKNLSTDIKQLGGKQLGIAIGAFFLDTRAHDGSISLLQNTDTQGATVLITSSPLNCKHLTVQDEMENMMFKMIQYAEKEGSLYRYANAIAMQKSNVHSDDKFTQSFQDKQTEQETVHENTVKIIEAMMDRHRYPKQFRRESMESTCSSVHVVLNTPGILDFNENLPSITVKLPSIIPSSPSPSLPISNVSTKGTAQVRRLQQLKNCTIINLTKSDDKKEVPFYQFGFFPLRKRAQSKKNLLPSLPTLQRSSSSHR